VGAGAAAASTGRRRARLQIRRVTTRGDSTAPIRAVTASVFVIPTDALEADGTFAWDRTTLVVAEVEAGGERGIGYTYADAATAQLIRDSLAPRLAGRDALALPARYVDMVGAIRNLGRPGVASMAISAVDSALWDVKGKLLGISVAALLGTARDRVQVYGSGGFTSYDDARLRAQLGGWAAAGFRRVKMKVGTHPQNDPARVASARAAIGPAVELYVDANGAYTRKQALAYAERFAAASDVRWFEEPVSSDDLPGLRLLRDRAPAGVDIAAGEYGYDPFYFRRMLEAGAVDVLQADATRCGGITGFVGVHALCDAHGLPLSAHCAPALHAALGCALPRVCHLEYFHDHQRIEGMLFDGAPAVVEGTLAPDRARPGLGLALKGADAARFAA
jgi:L-alanine-DL-glutamate epimerase-like enolase superfamily enzyme